MKTGCLILAGGKSSRMGRQKSSLKINGMTFLEHLAEELSGYGEVLVSVDRFDRHKEILIPMIEDLYPDHGPMGGIYSAFAAGNFDRLLTVPCDVPLFSGELAEKLCELSDEDVDAVIIRTKDGRIHPLCGMYQSSCLPVFRECLEKRELRMMQALEKLNVIFAEAGEDSWQLQNINTPEEYRLLVETYSNT